MQETLTPKYIDEPTKGYKSWRVKDERGRQYYAAPGVAAQLRVGEASNVEVEEEASKDGQKTWNIIKRVLVGLQPETKVEPQKPQADKEEGMFVMAVMGKLFEGTGALPDQDVITNMIVALRNSWRQSLNAKAELNDDVPF
jgi:hypothetical protein